MLFVRGGILGSANLRELITLQLPSGRYDICFNEIEGEPERVLGSFPQKRVCLSRTDLLEGNGFVLEHTQEFGEPTHWTGRLNLGGTDAEDEQDVVEATRRTVQSAFRGPMSKEEARERADTQSLRGLQPPE